MSYRVRRARPTVRLVWCMDVGRMLPMYIPGPFPYLRFHGHPAVLLMGNSPSRMMGGLQASPLGTVGSSGRTKVSAVSDTLVSEIRIQHLSISYVCSKGEPDPPNRKNVPGVRIHPI